MPENHVKFYKDSMHGNEILKAQDLDFFLGEILTKRLSGSLYFLFF